MSERALRAELSQGGEPVYFERPRLLGSILVVGALLVGVAGLFHPILAGDASAQLAAIVETRGWRLIHWSMAFGHVVAVAAMASLTSTLGSTAARSAARLGLSLVLLGYGVSLVGILFMLGPAHSLATNTAALPADTAFLYEMLHPFARAALRVAAFALSLGLCCVGWAMKRAGRSVLGWLAIISGLVGSGVALALSEHSPAIVTGIGLASVWQAVTGVVLFTHPRQPTHGVRP